MSSTHLSLHYHIIFSTKDRQPWIAPKWRDQLHAYLGGIIRHLDGVAKAVGGTSDHVHLLINLRATHRLSDVVRDLKRASSEWVHTEQALAVFAWQEGYGAFTVSESSVAAVIEYIQGQEEHHHHRSFMEEYLGFLRKNRVVFDERFVD